MQTMSDLNTRLIAAYTGRVVRKDLVQRIKKGTNAPTFVLEFLLARFCATDDPDEIEAGLLAVTETIQGNFVRPNESNAAQSLVQQRGRHKFIDKVRVTHHEKEKRHWAEMENFGSRRIAINDVHYRNNSRLLEGGLWCEVTVAYNPVEDDEYTFYIEELRPIQVSRFDFDAFLKGRSQFTRDEWRAILLRSLGLEDSALTTRQKFHYLARLFPLVEPNYNYLELGPRGTGKSYTYSEFSPYATLVSGGQTTSAILFYNRTRKQVGIIGYWDVIAFDEVAGMKVKDPGTIQILKDFMANGRFNIGAEVTAPASLVFIGNIDDAIADVVRSPKHDLFKPLPPEFDLAVMHRFHAYMPGWEIPASADHLLTSELGFITDYVAEAFHHLSKHKNFFDTVKKRARLGDGFQGRDQTAVCKTVSALLKLLHPDGTCTDAEFEEYLAYAIEGRRRIKEQLNKRKPDDEFAQIHLAYIDSAGRTVEVHCPESVGVEATLNPRSAQLTLATTPTEAPVAVPVAAPIAVAARTPAPPQGILTADEKPALTERNFTIRYGDTGYSYRSIFGPYLAGAKAITIEDPYIRKDYQIRNFINLCELLVETTTIKSVKLVTAAESDLHRNDVIAKFEELAEGLSEKDIAFTWEFNQILHDRSIILDNGWIIQIGRGLDIYQGPMTWLKIGATNYDLRPCMETKVNIYRN
jgi:ATP-dependent Lon protease